MLKDMSKRVIVLFGNAGHGKSTVAKMMQELIPNSCICSFASPVKEAVHAFLGLGYVHDASVPSKATVVWGRTMREWYQWMGTEVGRARDPNHWVDVMFNNLSFRFRQGIETVIIDDGRFMNEWEMNVPGAAVRRFFVKRYGHTAEGVNPGHQSELEVHDVYERMMPEDIIFNECCLDRLQRTVEYFVERWL